MEYVILLLCLLFASQSLADDTVQMTCKPKPGCSFAHCDPVPPGLMELAGFDAGLYRKQNAYHIVCERNAEKAPDRQGYGWRDDFEALRNDLEVRIDSIDKKLKKRDRRTDQQIDTKLEELQGDINNVFVHQFEGVRQRVRAVEEKLLNKSEVANAQGSDQIVLQMKNLEKKFTKLAADLTKQIKYVQADVRNECKAQISALDAKFTALLNKATRPGSKPEVYEDKKPDVTIAPAPPGHPTCPEPPEIAFGSSWRCSNGYNIGSLCTISCIQNHAPEGGINQIECKDERKWSVPSPKCVCKAGFVGENCELSTSWVVFKRNLDDNGGLNLNFAGNPMNCRNEGGFYRWKWVYKCYCTDTKTGKQAKCSNYASDYGSCEHTTATLIRNMAGQGIYPKPIDGNIMPHGC